MEPVIFGCAGLGGFAGTICDRLLVHSQVENPKIRLIAACDPEPQRQPARVAQLKAAGVKVLNSFTELLAEPVEAVWLPVPIELHRPFTEQALAAGKQVMCEKPAAGCVDDVDAMIAARDRAKLHVAVGFQDVYQPPMVELKDRFLSGELGKPISATLLGCWPRGDRYYHRNSWAGAMQRNGVWIVDSPANNALAHYVHLVLYLLGATAAEAAEPTHVAAELYRVNEIENYDTCTMRLKLSNGANFLVALTHACLDNMDPEIEIVTDRATVRLMGSRSIQVTKGESTDTVTLDGTRYRSVIGAFARRLRGDPMAPAGGTLEMARAHIVAVNGASQAAAVKSVPEKWVSESTLPKDGSSVRTINDITPILRQCVRRQQLLSESGLAPWAQPPGSLDLTGYRHFAGPKKA